LEPLSLIGFQNLSVSIWESRPFDVTERSQTIFWRSPLPLRTHVLWFDPAAALFVVFYGYFFFFFVFTLVEPEKGAVFFLFQLFFF